MKISIGTDHRGVNLKQKIIQHFSKIEWIDLGSNDAQKTDYCIYAKKVCENILSGKSDLGILICGSGIGMSIAANRMKKIYAGLCLNEEMAKAAREDDNINVLVLGADFLSPERAFSIIEAWRLAKFKGGHYQKRLELLEQC